MFGDKDTISVGEELLTESRKGGISAPILACWCGVAWSSENHVL